MFDDVTQSANVKFDRVLVIYEFGFDAEPLFVALRRRFIVRSATTVIEAVETSRASPIACIVAVIGGVITARGVVEALTSVAPILLLRASGVRSDDDVLILTSAIPWLPVTAAPSEIVERIEEIVAARV
jgi:hypothetical protein